jgi:hypothetical protein
VGHGVRQRTHDQSALSSIDHDPVFAWMGNLLFWLGIGAAQKGAGLKPIERRHWVASLVVGILGALLIAVGMFFLLVSQQ